MKNVTFLFFFILFSFVLSEEENFNLKLNNNKDNNNYILKVIPINKVEIVTFGKKYYSIYKSYEDNLNQQVTNYTIPEDFREYISFKLVIKKNPVIKYSYKYNFNGINIDYKFLKLDKAFEFLSYIFY